MADPALLFKSGSTKYLTPLFAPAVILNSSSSSKSVNCSSVMISPAPDDSPPVVACTVSTPSFMVHPLGGKFSDRALRQPVDVFPSHNNLHPLRFSRSVS